MDDDKRDSGGGGERRKKKEKSLRGGSFLDLLDFLPKKSSIVIVNRETISLSPRHSVTDTEEIAFQVGGNVLVTG